jgi:PAB1-binding protein PBP1
LDDVGFRTDADISQNGPNPRERELQAWSDGTSAPGSMPSSSPAPGGRGDDVTFGSTGSGHWDQFTVNQQLFGVTTNFDEELYTTKLDRSRPGFEERERQAQQIANEIQNVCEVAGRYLHHLIIAIIVH